MASLSDNIALFLQQTGMSDKTLHTKLIEFFQPPAQDRHILYKQSILYLFEKDLVLDSETKQGDVDDGLGATVFSFDGKKITRVAPEYYVGSADYTHSEKGWEFEIELSNNSNNNNNNNNGNNNG